MNNGEIKNVMDIMFRKAPKLTYNVIPCDYLQYEKGHFPLALIVNDQPAGHPGSHWVAIFIEGRGRPLEFFCSFGRDMLTYPSNFNDFTVRLGLDYNQVNFDVQALDSKFCGEHALYFLYHRAIRRTPFSSFYAGYKCRTPYENDKLVEYFVKCIKGNKVYMGR